MNPSVVRSAVLCSAVSLLGSSPIRLSTPPEPQRLVAAAPIWGANDGHKGYAFLPVTIHGHAASVVIDLNCTECDLSLSTAALAHMSVSIPATATTLDSLTIGHDVQRNIPLHLIQKPTWQVPGPPTAAPVVGIVGVHFFSTRYDLVYDFPERRVQLYAFPAAKSAWLPPGFTPAGCAPMIVIPPGAATFTGVAMQLDGHPVTGALEMGPYLPKLNQLAFNVLGLPANSPRIEAVPPGETDGGHPRLGMIQDVHMTVGTTSFGVWRVEELDHLDVEELLPPQTPIMLLNLTMLRQVKLFNAVSRKQVCITAPVGG